LTDIARSTYEDSRDIVSRRLNETAQNLNGNLRGRSRKHKARVAKRRQKEAETEAYKKRYFLLSLTVAANHVYVCEFRVRHICYGPIQTSVVETTEVTYKPLASAEQSDLEIHDTRR